MTPRPPVLIVDTGVANIASLIAAFERLGASAALTRDPGAVTDAPALVLPGVGSFAAGMAALNSARLADPIRDRLRAERPTLAVCLGLQLLAESSEESPGVDGLAVLPVAVRRFPGGVRVPQLGWNLVEPAPNCSVVSRGHAYFANSYRIPTPPRDWAAAVAGYAGPFVAAVERGPVLACQFHPELSGRYGLNLLDRWLVHAAEEAGVSC